MFGRVDNTLEPCQRSHEIRETLFERILHTNAGLQIRLGQAESLCADAGTGLSEHDVEANGAQQRALSGHVRAGYKQNASWRTDTHTVGHSPAVRNERMPQALCRNLTRRDNLRYRPLRVVALRGGEQRQHVELAD